MISEQLQKGKANLKAFKRSPFHQQLSTPIRDLYTELYENSPHLVLGLVGELLEMATKIEKDCLELGTQKSPRRVKHEDINDYAYRFVVFVLTATLPYKGEVVRHLCNNRACINPEHLTIGSQYENVEDEKDRRYTGDTT